MGKEPAEEVPMSRTFAVYPALHLELDPIPSQGPIRLGIFLAPYFLILNQKKAMAPLSFSSRKNGKMCLFTVSISLSLTLLRTHSLSPVVGLPPHQFPICSRQRWPLTCTMLDSGLISGWFKMCVFSHCCIPAPEAWHPVGK